MAKAPPKKKPVRRKELEAVELEPDAWDRFTKAVHKIAPPRRREKSKADQAAAGKRGKPKGD